MREQSAVLRIDSRCRLGEGIIWCARRRVLHWADIPAAQLRRHKPDRNETHCWPLPQALGCLVLADDGRLLLGPARGLYACEAEGRIDASQRPLSAPAAFGPGRFRPRPLSAPAAFETDEPMTRIHVGSGDRHGGFAFSTESEHAEHRRVGRFYQFTARHGLQELALPRVAIPNSICCDAEGTGMFFCDSIEPRILSCRCAADTASVSDPRLLVERDPPDAAPEGSVVDAEGFLWNAQWGAGRRVRHRPDGGIDRIVCVSASQSSRCASAGDTRYVTTDRAGLDAGAAAAQPHAGSVSAYRTGRVLERPQAAVRLS